MKTLPDKLLPAVYVGDVPELKGRKAIVRPHRQNADLLKAQFDDVGLTHRGYNLWSGWHTFIKTDFEGV